MAKEYRSSERIKREPTHPGEVLAKDVLPALDLSVRDAAQQLGVTRQTLHRILARKQPVTPEMAVRLGRKATTRAREDSSTSLGGLRC